MTQESQDLASITSLVGRFPVFTTLKKDNVSFMRLKDEVVFGKTADGQNLYIIPTDDQRLSFIVVPVTSEPANMIELV